jgi:hypothetical protein
MMTQNPPAISITDFLKCIRERLDEATAIAKAAEACAEAGNPVKGVTIVLDVEQLVYEVNTFLNAASLLNRYRRRARPARSSLRDDCRPSQHSLLAALCRAGLLFLLRRVHE